MPSNSWQWRGVVTTSVAAGALFALVLGSAFAVLSAVAVYAVAMATGGAVALDVLVGLWIAGAVVALGLGLVPASLVVRTHGGAHAVLGPVAGVVGCLAAWALLPLVTDHSTLTLLAGPLLGAVLAGNAVRPRVPA